MQDGTSNGQASSSTLPAGRFLVGSTSNQRSVAHDEPNHTEMATSVRCISYQSITSLTNNYLQFLELKRPVRYCVHRSTYVRGWLRLGIVKICRC